MARNSINKKLTMSDCARDVKGLVSQLTDGSEAHPETARPEGMRPHSTNPSPVGFCFFDSVEFGEDGNVFGLGEVGVGE